jgi:hypothetical protein
MLADNAESDLPTLVDLAPGEALDAYLERVADANYLTTARLIEMVRAGHDTTTAYLMLAPTPATLERIARLTGADAAALQNATLAAYDGTSLDLHGLDPAHQSSFRTISARGWIPGHGTQICPQCLADDGIWRTTWRLPTTTVCRTHGTYLLATCPGCQRPFRDQRHSPLRVVGPQTVCGNPLGQGPRKQCRVDLTTLTAEPADDDCLQRQARQDTADAGGTVATFAGGLAASEFTTTLRSLTALLLHLAAATRTPVRPPLLGARRRRCRHDWCSALEHPPTPRPRPPLTPALTAADHILAAEDIDTAATRFGSWLRAPPRRPRRPARMAGRPHPHDTDPDATRHGRPRTAASPVPSPRPATTAHRLDPTDPASPSPAPRPRPPRPGSSTPAPRLSASSHPSAWPEPTRTSTRGPTPRENSAATRTRRTHRPRLLRVDDRVARRRRSRPRPGCSPARD